MCVETRVSTLALRGTQKCIYASKRARSPCRQWFMELGLTNRPYKLLLNWVVALITIFVSEMLRTTDFPHAVRAHIRAYGRSACLYVYVCHIACVYSLEFRNVYPSIQTRITLPSLLHILWHICMLLGLVVLSAKETIARSFFWSRSGRLLHEQSEYIRRWAAGDVKWNLISFAMNVDLYTQSVYFANTIQQNAFAQHRGGSYHDTDDWSKIILARQEPARYEKMVC